jgi:GNAT superfamily N-acetyltransferase
MSLVIREAREADLPAIKAMMREFIDYLNAIDEPEEVPEEAINRIDRLAFGPEKLSTPLMADVDGRPAGYLLYFIGVFADPMVPVVFVADLFVREAGRRSGAGSALMLRAREIARAIDANRVVWTVWRKNARALAFYEALGARAFDEEILMTWPVDPAAAEAGP